MSSSRPDLSILPKIEREMDFWGSGWLLAVGVRDCSVTTSVDIFEAKLDYPPVLPSPIAAHAIQRSRRNTSGTSNVSEAIFSNRDCRNMIPWSQSYQTWVRRAVLV